ncbi:hypothetical protein DPMN_054246 [Dreissena polymorpha]|uniref:Uncharacterized protein n=1 Tax=Dreissena polymorpha TaxID=45954 RepID=A0A9D4HPI6_DREPO|nr:hypothetical protein DPMN_054246 [Dreissena polymorpha]
MWTDRRLTKTNPKPSPEQSGELKTIFHLVREINKTNAKNVTSKVKTTPPPGGHDIYKTNLFTKFHDDWANNVTSRNHVIQLTGTIFELNSRIKETNVLTKFHEYWAKNVTSRVFIRETAPPTGGHVFQRTQTTFKLNQHIIKANILTKFHENWAKNVTSRAFTCFHYIHIEKNAPPSGGHVFSPIWTIFELVRHINKTNVLTNFHDDWAKIVTSRVFTRKTALPTGGHVFQRTGTTFELNQHINKANILTNFELDRDIIGTNLLTKFHEDRTINVASRVFTNKCGRMTDGRWTKTGHKSSPE